MLNDKFTDNYSDGTIVDQCAPNPELLRSIVKTFHHDGWVHVPNILLPTEVQSLRNAIDRKRVDPVILKDEESDQIRGVGLMRMFEYSRVFRDLIIREPIASIVDEILGDDCHVIAQTALCTPKGNGLVNWHIDDHLFFPFPGMFKPNESVTLPCNVLNVMWPLTDIELSEHGPTQVVSTSHYSGTIPIGSQPIFNENEGTSVFAKAGDVYLLNNQVWHRGAQNYSERIRYMAITAYGRRFISQRFFPFLNYRVPDHVLSDASDVLLRFLGKHDKGPYG